MREELGKKMIYMPHIVIAFGHNGEKLDGRADSLDRWASLARSGKRLKEWNHVWVL